MSAVIQFQQVSKQFILHHERPRSFQELGVGLFRRNGNSREEFWALKDVSFAAERGETVGVIGSNGAGKSTLLKLISRIIEPTSGRLEVNGRLGALLELGAGFHPDLTGRENVYLNGSILGLNRREISQRLESIVEFAELSRFIDMPIRNYSSGMLMRLGFAVATSFQPDILLIDEVLAVGDRAFQTKCYRRIDEVRNCGVTMLFVSHGLESVQRLCDRAIWLQEGKVQAIGNVESVITDYLVAVQGQVNAQLAQQAVTTAHMRRWGSGEAVIKDVQFLDADGRPHSVFRTGERMVARIAYHAQTRIRQPSFGVAIYRDDDVHVSGPNSAACGLDLEAIEGDGFVDYIIDALPLMPGRYEFTAAIYDHYSVHPYDHQHRAYVFEVQAAESMLGQEGVVQIPCRWEHHRG